MLWLHWLFNLDPLPVLAWLAAVGLVAIARLRAGRVLRDGGDVGLSGAEAAAEVLAGGGPSTAAVRVADGPPRDDYDAGLRVVRLAPATCHGTSAAAVAVAALEAGQALRHDRREIAAALRGRLVPGGRLAAGASLIVAASGVAYDVDRLLAAGLYAHAASVLAALALLPGERAAARIARRALAASGRLAADRMRPVALALDAAGWRPVAAAFPPWPPLGPAPRSPLDPATPSDGSPR